MSAPLYVSLTLSQCRKLRALRRDPTLRARERDRVECLLHPFGAEGMAAVRRRPRGVRPDRVGRRTIEVALDRQLQRQQIWSSAGLAVALAAEEDIHLQPRTVRKYLQGMGAYWRHTHATPRQQQDPDQAAAARAQLADFNKKPWLTPLISFPGRERLVPVCPPHLGPARCATGRPLRDLPRDDA